MKPHFWRHSLTAAAIAFSMASASGLTLAQMDTGPKTEKTYGIGLPRDHASQLFGDADYPVFALKPGQEVYRGIDGARMKRDVVALSQISLKHRDTVNRQMWGRFPGTVADREGVKYMTDEFERLGMTIKHYPFTLPKDWRPESWRAGYSTSAGAMMLAFGLSSRRLRTNRSLVIPLSRLSGTEHTSTCAFAIPAWSRVSRWMMSP
jgi:hypothetical protein